MRDIAITLIVFGLLPFALARPYVGVLLWSWLGYMNPHRLSWGFAYGFPFSQLTAIATLLGLLFSRDKQRFPLMPLTVIWLLFISWMMLTTLTAFDQSSAIEQLIKVLKIQLIALITLMTITGRERIILLIWVIALSVGFFGIKGGIFTILTGGNFRVWGPPGTFIEGNNEIALALLMVLPFFYFLFMQVSKKWQKMLLLTAMLMIALSVVGSYSRGAFLAGFSVTFVLWLKSRNKILSGPVIVILILGLLAFMPEQWHHRMSTIETYQEDASAMGRINSWWAAYYIASDRFFGGGFEVLNNPNAFASYAPNPQDKHDAHSIYFEIMSEHGFVGLFLFLLIGWQALRMAGWIIRHAQDHEDLKWALDLGRMSQASLVAYATGGAFLGLAYFDLYYHILAILVLTKLQVQKKLVEVDAGEKSRNILLANRNKATSGRRLLAR